MSNATVFRTALVSSLAAVLWLGCGAGTAGVGGKNGTEGNGADAGVDGGGNSATQCTPTGPEICDGIDNDCDGTVDFIDADNDGFSICAPDNDCDDTTVAISPGASEVANDLDDNCDGKVDFGVPGVDYDKDGTPYPEDCSDDEPLIGPNAIEVPGDNTDNNCNGEVDEAVDCEAGISGNTATDFLRAIGLCGAFVDSASFVTGNGGARAIRAKFGDHFTPRNGSKLIHLSSGRALDLNESSYSPQLGEEFSSLGQPHPLWAPADCYPQSTKPSARDLTELKVTLTVPQNAKSFSYDVNFFSAEYPEWVCTQFNDRFVALLTSSALDPSKLPGGADKNCVETAPVPQCNVSFDAHGQPLTVNSGFFDICQSDPNNPKIPYTCGKPALPLLEQTGYDLLKYDYNDSNDQGPLGGATDWLTTRAPVTPGETVTLRFLIFDEGDSQWDSAVLIDNFKWELESVTAPSTEPIN